MNKNFYAICEMAQEVIKTRSHQNSWSIQSYPGKVKLPSDILRPLPNAETANKVCDRTFPLGFIYVLKIVKTVYLSEEASAALTAMLKSGQRGSTIKVRISTTKSLHTIY